MLQIIPQLLHEGCQDVSALKDWFATNPQLRGSFLLAVHGGSQPPMLCKAGLLLDSWELVCPQEVSPPPSSCEAQIPVCGCRQWQIVL